MVLWLLSSLRVGGIEDIGLLCMHQGREREGGGLNSIHFVEDVRTLHRWQPLVRNLILRCVLF